MKLFSQYNRITLSVLIGFFLLSSGVYWFLMRELLREELDKSLVKTERRIRDYGQQHHSLPAVEQLDDLRVSYTPVADTGARTLRLISPRKGRNTDNIREMDFFMQLDHQWYRIGLSRNLEGVNATAIMVLKTAGVILVIVGIAWLCVNRLVFRRLWRPFFESIGAIGKFELGKNQLVGFPRTRIEEFDFMNDQFRRMAEKVNNEYGVLKEFTENASHEMQTPLAVIRSKLDLAIQDPGLSKNQSASLQSAYAAVKRLASLNRSLLLIAKISNHQYSGSGVVDIKQRLQDKITQFEELWAGKLTMTYELRDAEIDANPDLFDILLNNLFSNAGRHNIPNGTVRVLLTSSVLEIENTGRPEPLDETRIFQRFYKGSQQEESESNGLGLSILKEICTISGITPSYSHHGNRHAFRLVWNNPDRPVPL